MPGVRQSAHNALVLFGGERALHEVIELFRRKQQLPHDRPLRARLERLSPVGDGCPERFLSVQIVPARVVFAPAALHAQLCLQDVEHFVRSE